MPFKKLGTDKYQGPSGKVFSAAQVRLYYSRGGSFPGEKASVDDPAEHVAERAAASPAPKLKFRKVR